HQVTMQELLADFDVKTAPRLLYDGPEIGGMVQMGRWFARCAWRLWRERAAWFPQRGSGALILVHGDTMSTLLGALAGRFAGVPVAHVESGLRSFRVLHPFPEELTRLA